jgi:hypothetical protein
MGTRGRRRPDAVLVAAAVAEVGAGGAARVVEVIDYDFGIQPATASTATSPGSTPTTRSRCPRPPRRSRSRRPAPPSRPGCASATPTAPSAAPTATPSATGCPGSPRAGPWPGPSPPRGWSAGPAGSGSPPPRRPATYLLDSVFEGRGRLALGTYDEDFATAWRSLGRELSAWERTCGVVAAVAGVLRAVQSAVWPRRRPGAATCASTPPGRSRWAGWTGGLGRWLPPRPPPPTRSPPATRGWARRSCREPPGRACSRPRAVRGGAGGGGGLRRGRGRFVVIRDCGIARDID